MEILLDALKCQNKNRPPVWLMRQAGRYLPQYRKLKVGRSLYEMFHNVETIVEVTQMPVDFLGVDGAILFSDILTVLEGLNVRYDFQEGVGPVVLDGPDSLALIAPEEVYGHISGAIRELKKELKVPLLGFAGAPFTIASYIIEGKTSRDLQKTKKWLFSHPEGFKKILDLITEATIQYLKVQIEAGVAAVQIFDSWANALALEEFRLYALEPMRRIVEAMHQKNIPVILFCRNSCLFAKELASIAPSAISLDWSYDLATIRKQIPNSIAVQGNIDPMALYAPKDHLKQKVDALLDSMEGDPGYIFNLGHGLLPDTPVENVQFIVDYVRNRSRAFT